MLQQAGASAAVGRYTDCEDPEEITGPILPHSDFGDPECCGTLWGLPRPHEPDTADIICNECETIVRTVATTDLRRTLGEMEATLEVACAICPHCENVNIFPGFSEILAFVCHECGGPVRLSDHSVPTLECLRRVLRPVSLQSAVETLPKT